MPLGPGTRLGPYEILAAIGAGGMGEVYRARDARLQRDVAIKVLPATFASDPERLTRFEQEARAAAALNHPNILAVFDLGTHAGAPYIVSELLEGETLREHITGLSVRKAIDYAIQIAHGLAAAHEKGIVHRDLKPENIFITSGGRVKILDFGLAKLTQPDPAVAGISALATMPAINAQSPPHTMAGVILGTVGYMAPEQVRGIAADHRADIFAFGAILYEMLSGRRAFGADTTLDTMMAIAKEAPPELPSAERHIPPALARIVERCLEKNPASRFKSADDLAFALEGLSTQSGSIVAPPVGARARIASNARAAWTIAAVLVVVAGLLAVAVVRDRRTAASSVGSAIARLVVPLPAGDEVWNIDYPQLALSNDGTELVYAAVRSGKAQLYLRRIDSLEPRAIPGTEGAVDPFFSPDGQWVGFFAQGKLKTVSIAAGAVQVLCDAPGAGGKGGSWSADNTIYFAPTNISGIWKVSANGGTPEPVTRLDRSKGEVSHRWPQVLPGGRAILFSVWNGPGDDEKRIEVQSLENGERHTLVQGADMGKYISGRLVYSRGDLLMTIPMDIASLQVGRSAPVPLTENVHDGGEGAQFAVSDLGVLAYLPGNPHRYERRVVWVNRQGVIEPLALPARNYESVALSPDGRQIAVGIGAGTRSIWLYDVARSTLTPLTTGAGSSQSPAWSPDGKRLAYRGTRTGFRNLFLKTVDDPSPEQRLTTKENTLHTPSSFSGDGRWLAFSEQGLATGNDIWVIRLDDNGKAQPFLATPSDEVTPRFSPDSHWIAYLSNESGQYEVYVQPFPGPGGKRLISTDGGTAPVWSRDGRQLFYVNQDQLMAVDVAATAAEFSVSKPRVLFEGRYVVDPTGVGTFDVSLEGDRFLRIQPTEPEPPTNQINVVMNWFAELKAASQ